MAGIASKRSQSKWFGKGANRRDRRSQVNVASRLARRAYLRAVRREGKREIALSRA